MKQLLHNCGEHIIVGLNEAVFVGLGDAFCELPPVNAAESLDEQPNANEAASHVGAGGGGNPAATTNPREVQAVAVTVVNATKTNGKGSSDSSIWWCAVARYDKTLSVYQIRQSDGTLITAELACVHKTLKRVSTLCFATVYGSRNSSSESITVVVTGDLAGDATAFPLEPSAQETAKPPPNEAVNSDDDTTGSRRLLLGHTASMLTSVHVATVPRDSNDSMNGEPSIVQRILTSDRDEKIRVSSFPSTHIIEGFLLGHEAFVSSVAVLSQQQHGLCVSVGGDDTLRLWDCQTCQELARTTVSNINHSNQEGKDRVDNESNLDSTAASAQALQSVPTKVVVSPDGLLVAVICDNSKALDFWRIYPSSTTNESDKPTSSNSTGSSTGSMNHSLEHCGRFDCVAQPLGVAFVTPNVLLIAMREPDYLQAVQVAVDDISSTSISIVPVEKHSFCNRVQQAAREQSIVMPQQLLERDDDGTLKMQKMNEVRSGATIKPWNNSVRKETDKERTKRLRKRRRDDAIAERDEQDNYKQTV